MSVPDIGPYLAEGLRVFTRHSDVEPVPSYYDACDGIWLDEMEGPWITGSAIQGHLQAGKHVAVVSPELHGRDYRQLWDACRPFRLNPKFMLCTDYPRQALEFLG